MIRKINIKWRIPIAIGLALLGTNLFVYSYTPGGSYVEEVSLTVPEGTVLYYGAEISSLLVMLSVCCFMGAYYFYHNRGCFRVSENEKSAKVKCRE